MKWDRYSVAWAAWTAFYVGWTVWYGIKGSGWIAWAVPATLAVAGGTMTIRVARREARKDVQ